MKRVIIGLMIVVLAGLYLPNTYAGYNVHQKAEAEKEYKQLSKLVDNIEEALRDMDKIKEKPVSMSSHGDLAIYSAATTTVTWSVTLGGGGYGDHVEVEICEAVANSIRNELKVLLQDRLKEFKRQRKEINVD